MPLQSARGIDLLSLYVETQVVSNRSSQAAMANENRPEGRAETSLSRGGSRGAVLSCK